MFKSLIFRIIYIYSSQILIFLRYNKYIFYFQNTYLLLGIGGHSQSWVILGITFTTNKSNEDHHETISGLKITEVLEESLLQLILSIIFLCGWISIHKELQPHIRNPSPCNTYISYLFLWVCDYWNLQFMQSYKNWSPNEDDELSWCINYNYVEII